MLDRNQNTEQIQDQGSDSEVLVEIIYVESDRRQFEVWKRLMPANPMWF